MRDYEGEERQFVFKRCRLQQGTPTIMYKTWRGVRVGGSQHQRAPSDRDDGVVVCGLDQGERCLSARSTWTRPATRWCGKVWP